MSVLIYPALFGLIGLISYLWFLMHGRDFAALIPTHRAKVMVSVKKTTWVYLPVYIVFSFMYVVIVEASMLSWSEENEKLSDFQDRSSWNLFLFAVYATIMIPYVAVVHLFYVESIRLKYVTGDFCELLKTAARARHLDYSLLTSAYMALELEWAQTQKIYGAVGGVLFFITAGAIAGGCVIVVGQEAFYESAGWDEAYRAWLPYFIYVPYIFFPYLVFVSRFGVLNGYGNEVRDLIRQIFVSKPGMESMALVSLNEWNPVGLELLGRRIDLLDIATGLFAACASAAYSLAAAGS